MGEARLLNAGGDHEKRTQTDFLVCLYKNLMISLQENCSVEFLYCVSVRSCLVCSLVSSSYRLAASRL